MGFINIKNSNIYYLNNKHYVSEYFNYILLLLKSILLNNNLSINIILGKNDYVFDNKNKVFRLIINYEHTLVKEWDKDVPRLKDFPNDTPKGKITYGENENYFVRIYGIDNRYDNCDLIIDYSIPNIYNVAESKLFDDFSSKHIYIAPSIYKDIHINKNNRNINVLTTFLNIDGRPRREVLLKKMKKMKLDHKNINNCWGMENLKKLLKKTKILINIHQREYLDTFEELRVLPALQNGVIVVAENSPLNELIPYNDLIIWSDYDNILEKVKEVMENYDKYYDSIFSDKHIDILRNLNDKNYKTLKENVLIF